MALWELDEFKPPTFLGFVRSVPPPPGFSGNKWLADRIVPDLEFEYILGANRKSVMAHVMGFDGEAPIHGRPGLGERVSGELPPIKRKARIGEKAIIRFLAPRSGMNDVDEAINQVYGLTGELLDAVQARFEWLRMQALSEDKVIYDEGGVIFQFDFGLRDDFQVNVATGADGSGAAVPGGLGGAWNLPDTSNPLTGLRFISDRVQQRTGSRPAELVCSAAALGFLLSNDAIRGMIRGAGAPDTVITETELNTILTLFNLPRITTYDVFVAKEEADGTYTDVRTMAENKAFLPPPDLGRLLQGPTAESRVVYGTPLAARAPGLWAETYSSTEPPAEWVKVAATAFPSMPEAGRLAQMTLW